MPAELIEGLDSDEEVSFDQRPKFPNRFHEQPAKYKTEYPKERFQPREDSGPIIQPKSIAELKAYLEQKQKAGEPLKPAAKETAKQEPGLRTGMRVRHEQFGDGIILNRERTGNDFKLTITFSRVGKKTLVEKYAKLKAL
jgi:hypothetical protein